MLCIALLIGIVAQACKNNNTNGAATISIDSTNVYLPVIKIKLDDRQKNLIAKKAEWETISGLFSINNHKVSPYSVTCKYTVTDDTLIFTPVLPLGNGIDFEVQVYNQNHTATKRYTTPLYTTQQQVPSVNNIYPLVKTIPSNILMFHVSFSTSMNEDIMAFKDVLIVDENGVEKKMVWREKSNWANDGKHLVLMIHPGRIKRGIDYMEQLGPLFEEGKQYTLIIPPSLTDRYGQPLGQEYKKTFTICAPDRNMPAYKQSTFVAPHKNTKEAITLNFTEAIDYGTAYLGIEVYTADSTKVEGVVIPTNSDSQWGFVPTKNWQDKKYILSLNDYLADIASNHLTRKFEVKHIDSIAKRHTLKYEFLPQ